MLNWYAIYKGKPESTSHAEERGPRVSVLSASTTPRGSAGI